ncbi:MAG: lysophospholipid acyltransferase family protein [Candidatus Omnitrophota bacterium]
MYYLYLIGRFIAIILPRKTLYCLAILLSRLRFYFSKKDRRIVIANLMPMIADKTLASSYAKKVFENFALYLADFLSFSKMDRNFLKQYVRISGLDNLDKAQKEQGVIALTAHIGNYEMGGGVIASLGYDFYALALPHVDKRINAFFNQQRGCFGVKVIATGNGLKTCFRVLSDRKIVAFVGDKDFTAGKRKAVKICGKEVFLPRGPALFALKTNSLIVPCFFIRENRYYYHFIFEPPIAPTDNNRPKTVREIMEQYSEILEKYIRQYPEQWYIFERYWPSMDN